MLVTVRILIFSEAPTMEHTYSNERAIDLHLRSFDFLCGTCSNVIFSVKIKRVSAFSEVVLCFAPLSVPVSRNYSRERNT